MTRSDRNERKRETAGHITTECNKKNGTETKKKEEKENTREIGRWKERERRSREHLMESGGVYRSAWQRRLFHLVIQLFSHLVDVVSPCEGSGRILRPPMQSDRITLKNSQVMILWVSDRAIQSCRLEKWMALAGLDVSLDVSPQIAPIQRLS